GPQLVVHQRAGGAHLDAADGVDHRLEPREIHAEEVVDLQSGEFLDHLYQAAGAAERIRRVQLDVVLGGNGFVGVGARRIVPALAARPVDVQVAGERDAHHAVAAGGDVHEHDRVRASALDLLGTAGAYLGVCAGAGVDADDQVVFVAVLTVGVADVVGIRIQGRDPGVLAVGDPEITPGGTGHQQREHGDEGHGDVAGAQPQDTVPTLPRVRRVGGAAGDVRGQGGAQPRRVLLPGGAVRCGVRGGRARRSVGGCGVR